MMTFFKVKLLYIILQLVVLVVSDSSEESSKSCEDLGDTNSHYICDETGEIRCLAGWSGEKCDIPKCADGCHPEHGFCTKPGECRCSLGWRGDDCKQCTPLPGCVHGFCNSSSFECICEDGWDGAFCNQPKCRDGCHETRGYCERTGECKCRIGWGGPTCEECKPLHGCVHGNCTKPLECRCQAGWTGLFCNTPICRTNCNKDHGSCTKPNECRCDVGWWGETCDVCYPYPGCKNGTCSKPWDCICNPGWKGMLCDEPDDNPGKCRNNPGACLNGGTCIDVPETGNFTCSCPSLFTGQRCDYLAEVSSPEIVTISDTLEPLDSPSQIQVVTADGSLLQATLRPANQSKRPQTGLSKEERKIILQNYSRISFRQPPNPTKEDDQPDNTPFKISMRKLLPLPVFLPRVSEIIPGDEGPTRILKSITKQPNPILILESRSNKDTLPQEPESPNRNQIDENRRFLRHQQGGPDFLPELQENAAADHARNPQALTLTSNKVVKVPSVGRQPLPVSAHAIALPRPNPVSPATLRTWHIPSQHSGANRQGLTRPPTTLSPNTSSSTTPLRNTSMQILKAQSRSSIWTPSDSISEEDDVIAEGSEDIQTYYEENSNGRVHIGDVLGVDDAAPHDEIYEAFIELKKV